MHEQTNEATRWIQTKSKTEELKHTVSLCFPFPRPNLLLK